MADRFLVAALGYNNVNSWAATSGGAAGAGVPTINDDVFFDTNSGANDCQASGAVAFKTLTADGNYSGKLDFNDQDITAGGDFTYDAIGNIDFGNATWTQTVAGMFHMGAGVGTISGASLEIVDQVGMTFDIDKNTTFQSYTNNTNGTTGTVLNGAAVLFLSNGGGSGLTLGDGVIFNINDSVYIFIRSGQANPVSIHSGATLGGTGALTFATTADQDFNIPPQTYVALTFEYSNDVTVTFTGTTKISGNISNKLYATKTTVLDFNDQTINVNSISHGNNNAGGTNTIKFGDGNTVTIAGNVSIWNNGGPSIFDMESAIIKLAGNATLQSNSTIIPGTAEVQFNGAGAQAITSVGETWPDVVVNKAGNTAQPQDAFAAASLDIDDGDWDDNGQTHAIAEDFDWDSAGTWTHDGAYIIGGGFHVGNFGTVNISGGTISLTGDSNLDVDKASLVFAITAFAAGKTTIWTGAAAGFGTLTGNIAGVFRVSTDLTLSGSTTFGRLKIDAGVTLIRDNTATYIVTVYVAGDINGSPGSTVKLRSDSVGTQVSDVFPAGTSVSYVDVQDSDASGGSTILAYTLNGNVDSGNNSVEWDFTSSRSSQRFGKILPAYINRNRRLRHTLNMR